MKKRVSLDFLMYTLFVAGLVTVSEYWDLFTPTHVIVVLWLTFIVALVMYIIDMQKNKKI